MASRWATIGVAAAALGLNACAQESGLPRACAVSGLERVGGPISLTDETGRRVTQADFAGNPTLLYFGFANCPDVCPMALQSARVALEGRDPASPINVALVTVDPARDTPAVLSQYVASEVFPRGLKGLTGTPTEIRAVTDAFKVYAQRRDMPESTADYTVDHSRLFYVMDADWKTAGMFQDTLAPAEMAACIEGALAK